MSRIRWCVLVCIILFYVSVSADHVQFTARVTDNPADELVAEINSNRTSQKGSSALFNNPGLACIALQFIKAYEGDCGAVGGKNAKKPPDSEIPEEFAPNCGVEASSLAPFTGRLLGCQSKYIQPKQAFSDILVTNDKALEIVHNSNHTEVGAGVSGADGGGPYFCAIRHIPYWIKPVAVPNPFTIKRNNQRSFRDPGLGVSSKQWEPTSIIPINSSLHSRAFVQPTITINSCKKLKLLFSSCHKILTNNNLLSFAPLYLLFFLHINIPKKKIDCRWFMTVKNAKKSRNCSGDHQNGVDRFNGLLGCLIFRFLYQNLEILLQVLRGDHE